MTERHTSRPATGARRARARSAHPSRLLPKEFPDAFHDRSGRTAGSRAHARHRERRRRARAAAAPSRQQDAAVRQCAGDLAAAEPDATPHALLAKAGALAGVPVEPPDADAQARILDFCVAVYQAGTGRKAETAFLLLVSVVNHTEPARRDRNIAATKWGIPLDAGAVGRFLAVLKQPTPNKALLAFFKSAKGDKATMDQIARAGTDYAALARYSQRTASRSAHRRCSRITAPWTATTRRARTLKRRA